MLVSETKPVRLVDQLGVEVSGVAWTSTNSSVATVAEVDGSPVVTAHAPGVTTITAELNSLSAELVVTVLNGTSLPNGTAMWTLTNPNLWGSAYLSQNEPNGAEQFLLASGSEGNVLAYGLNTDGEIVTIEGLGITSPLYADPFGGLILPVYDEQYSVVGLRRIGGQGAPWEYRASGYVSGNYGPALSAQGPDGTIYHLEYNESPTWAPSGFSPADRYRSLSLVVVDGQTGLAKSRTKIPMNKECAFPPSFGWGGAYPTSIFVAGDGAAYVGVASTVQGGCPNPNYPAGQFIYLVRADSTGASSLITLKSGSDPGNVSGAYYLTPDTDGGVILAGMDDVFAWSGPWRIRYRSGTITELTGMNDAWISMVSRDDTIYTAEADWQFRARTGDGTVKWTATLTETEVPFQALPDSAALVYDTATGILTKIDNIGARTDTTTLPLLYNPLSTAVDEVTGAILVPEVGTIGVVAKFTVAGNDNRTIMPNQYQLNAARKEPDSGIFAKGHEVLNENYHVAIRLVPRNQVFWRTNPTWKALFEKKINGLWYATLGAGPTGLLPCTGNLKSEPNRTRDVNVAATHLERLSVSAELEDTKIGLLLNRDSNYSDQLPYECFPDVGDGSYNSNGYAHGLLNAAGITAPEFPVTEANNFPGWSKPVPENEFD